MLATKQCKKFLQSLHFCPTRLNDNYEEMEKCFWWNIWALATSCKTLSNYREMRKADWQDRWMVLSSKEKVPWQKCKLGKDFSINLREESPRPRLEHLTSFETRLRSLQTMTQVAGLVNLELPTARHPRAKPSHRINNSLLQLPNKIHSWNLSLLLPKCYWTDHHELLVGFFFLICVTVKIRG